MPLRTVKIPLEIIALKGDGYQCFINVLLNGEIHSRMILDTGASRSVFDINLIRESELAGELEINEDKATGLGTNSMEGFILLFDSIKIGELEIKNYTAGILDLSLVNETYTAIGLPGINGAIGSDILYQHKAKIDFSRKILTLSIKPA